MSAPHLRLIHTHATDEDVELARVQFVMEQFHITPSEMLEPLLRAMIDYVAELELNDQTDQIWTNLYTALLFYEDLVSQYDE